MGATKVRVSKRQANCGLDCRMIPLLVKRLGGRVKGGGKKYFYCHSIWAKAFRIGRGILLRLQDFSKKGRLFQKPGGLFFGTLGIPGLLGLTEGLDFIRKVRNLALIGGFNKGNWVIGGLIGEGQGSFLKGGKELKGLPLGIIGRSFLRGWPFLGH